MKRCGIVVAIAGVILFSDTAWATEQTKNDGHSDGGHGTAQVQQPPAKQQEVKAPDAKMDDANSHNMTPEEHKSMNMDGKDHNMTPQEHMNMDSKDHNMTPQEHMNMDNSQSTQGESHDGQSSAGGHGSHGGIEEVVETPPNIPVLSTFGGIMLAFILYGACNKWLRKKEGAHV